MSRIYTSVSQLIGGTPLLELCNIEKAEGLSVRLLAKVEGMNPGGSAKDRVALSMVNDAEARGLLPPGGTIIEPTSGNTGIGLAAMGGAMGYKVVIIMPDTASEERVKLTKAYGADVILTPGALGMKGCIEKAEEIARETPNSFIPGQFDNPANAKAHEETTGPEIWEDTDGNVDIFVAGVGTGGTITGVGHYLKSKDPNVKIVAVEPKSSPLLSKGTTASHGIQGIGANFIPSVLDTTVYDEIITVSDEDAYELGREMGRLEGILVGISSGAALVAAIELAKRPENEGKNIVVLLPDTGDRYLSTNMFK